MQIFIGYRKGNFSPSLLLLTITLSISTWNLVGQETCRGDYSIDFVKFGQKKPIYSDEGRERVWLRFTNRANQKVIVNATDEEETLQFIRGSSAELGIYYEVVDKKKCDDVDRPIQDLPIGYKRREAYRRVTLKPGESFVFSVAKQYLLPGRAVYITYESRSDCGNPTGVHDNKAYFFSSALPKS